MTKSIKLISLLLLFCLTLTCMIACESDHTGEETSSAAEELEFIDYAATVTLDMSSNTLKEEVTVKQYIDGDTTHFNVPTSVMPNGVLKGRYLAINTPESTGQIEEWGKAASNYTKAALQSAVSIVIESDDGNWNADSTGSRYLVWVWYKTSEDGEYRNLNIEILQEGLAIASNSSQNRYGQTCMKAIDQAKAHKRYVYSGEKDPDYYYGSAIELTLKELRANAALYTGKSVAFEGVITKNDGASVYVENFDEETQMYHGISIYYGYNLNGMALGILSVGNRVRIVGSMQFYEAGGTYQVSDLKYDMMDPTAADNIQKISSDNAPAYVLTSPETFVTSKVGVTVINEDGEEELRQLDYAELALSTSIAMNDLEVVSVYTTNNGGDSDGAMTLTCKADGITVSVRTTVLTDENGKLVTEEYFKGKVIDVRGIVDYFDGSYQIKVFSLKDIVVK
ncbi:MAG: thermonuclease family protein [Clostridia bacterium]|nr:thermonuclease family protein [Clostridia bacterium]